MNFMIYDIFSAAGCRSIRIILHVNSSADRAILPAVNERLYIPLPQVSIDRVINSPSVMYLFPLPFRQRSFMNILVPREDIQ